MIVQFEVSSIVRSESGRGNGNEYTFELDLLWEGKWSYCNQIAVKMFGSVAAWSV